MKKTIPRVRQNRYVSAFGRLGRPFFSFLLSRRHRLKVREDFQKGSRLDKAEMGFQGIIHTCLALMICAMMVGVCALIIITIIGLFIELRDLF